MYNFILKNSSSILAVTYYLGDHLVALLKACWK